jgi:hypothetical protein
MWLWTCKWRIQSSVLRAADNDFSMGECSFGRGFGRTNPNIKEMESDDDQVWASIPRAIFLGMTKRYRVGHEICSM